MTFNILQTPYKILENLCEIAKRNNYPVTSILLSQIECKNEDVPLRLFVKGIKEEWWNRDELIALLDQIPKNDYSKQILSEILLYLDTTNLDLPLQKRVALVWSDYLEQYKDSNALFKRFKLLLESHPFSKGFKVVREQFFLLKPTPKISTVPFKGDLGVVMKTAMQDKKGIINNSLLARMELRWMRLHPMTLSRFNKVINELASNDRDGWEAAAKAFVTGADPKQVNLLLYHLKKHEMVDDVLYVLQYCLRYGYSFNNEYAYWCADQLLSLDYLAVRDLINRMTKSSFFNSSEHIEKQIRIYSTLAVFAEEESEAMVWISKMLCHRDENVWKGTEEVVLSCAAQCLKWNKMDHFSSFMSILIKTVKENHPLYGQVCALWREFEFGTDHHKNKETLVRFGIYLKSMANERCFRENVEKVVASEIEHCPKFLESHLDLLVVYHITDSEIWKSVFKGILESNNIPLQRKACKSWLNLPQEDSAKYWGIVFRMLNHFDIEGLNAALKKIKEEKMQLNRKTIENIVLACVTILEQPKKTTKAQKEELLSLLIQFTDCFFEDGNENNNVRLFKNIDIPLIKCFLTVPTYENLDVCCDILSKNLELIQELNVVPVEIFNEIFLRISQLKLEANDPLLMVIFLMAKAFLDDHKTSSTLIQTANIASSINTYEANILTWLYFQTCLSDQFFKQFSLDELCKLEGILKKILSADTSEIDEFILTNLSINKHKFALIFGTQRLPDFIAAFLDKKVKDFNFEKTRNHESLLKNYNRIFSYVIQLYANPFRTQQFENFLDFFVNTISGLEDPHQIDNMLKDLCKRFSKDTYADKKERVLYDNCLCKILYTLVSELSVIPQGTVYHRCLYNFLSDSIVNIPGKIAASRTGVSLQARSIELIKNFQACWPVKDHDLFLVHSKIILDLAESLINKVETNPVGQDLIKTTIKQIADHIEEHFTDLTNDQLQKLTDHVANALKTVKKNFKEQLYNRILVQALNRLLSGQKKGALNHLFLGKLFVLTCEIKASDAFISNLLIYTLLTIKQELKKDNPHIACLVNMILAGPQRLFRNILTSNVINEESDVKKYAYIFSEYVSLLTDLSFKLSNLGEPNPIKPFLDLLREAKVGK